MYRSVREKLGLTPLTVASERNGDRETFVLRVFKYLTSHKMGYSDTESAHSILRENLIQLVFSLSNIFRSIKKKCKTFFLQKSEDTS